MDLSDIGSLIQIPFDEIEPGLPCDAHDYLITATAKLLEKENRNWLPVIVQEQGPNEYKVVGNSFAYAVVAEADLEKVWCIVADPSDSTTEVSQALAKEIVPKTNLSRASREEIFEALDYLISQPDSVLKRVNLASAVSRIDEAPRQYWETFQPITKLGCGITRGKKVEALETIFFLDPEPLPDVITDTGLLESFTAAQLKKMAKERNLSGYSKLKKGELVKLLSTQDEGS